MALIVRLYPSDFCVEHPTMVGISERALRPLIREQDEEIRYAAIQKIGEDLKGKQHAGRGHKKKITGSDIVKALSKSRLQ